MARDTTATPRASGVRRASIRGVQRLVLVLLVATLGFSMSGLASLLVPEPCNVGEISGADSTCPPSCMTCGCCHRATDITRVQVVATEVRDVPESPALPVHLRSAAPRKILHVPKLVLA